MTGVQTCALPIFHNQVVNHLAGKYGYAREQVIWYTIGYGRADLISPQTGEVWEVKPNTPRQILNGRAQVIRYVNGTWKNNPNPSSITLQIGGYIPQGSFVYRGPLANYYVHYQYVGNGVVVYDYDEVIDLNLVLIGELLAAGALVYLGGQLIVPAVETLITIL